MTLVGHRDGDLGILRKFGPNNSYSVVYYTLMGLELGLEFGLKDGVLSQEALERIRLSEIFLPASAESRRVVEYFAWIARESKFFVALPRAEIPNASGLRISSYDLDKAISEGYVQSSAYGVEGELLELALQFHYVHGLQ
ncbi:MAG: hypothetical protein EPN86_05580 [Nanoarchaeota archaeon]|nr:MAG: hypothetical protein EPN86_05580 [Nanoarchaeota archaeon]